MENFIITLLVTPAVFITIGFLNATLFLVNYFALKVRKEYRGMKLSVLLLLSLAPCLNLIFLMLNLLLFFTYKSGYKLVKIRRKAKKPAKA